MKERKSTISLRKLAGYFLHKLWIICFVTVIAGALGLLAAKYLVMPMYESTTKMYILSGQNDSSQVGAILTKDCAEIIKSRWVLEKVINDYKLDMTYEELLSRLRVETSKDTGIVEIIVSNELPKNANILANAIRTAAIEHIMNVMNIEEIKIIDEANLPLNPASPSIVKWTIAGAVLGLVVSIISLVTIFLSDDTIKTSDDIEKYLNLSTLAVIPYNENEGVNENNRNSNSNVGGNKSTNGRKGESNAKYSTD